MPWRITSTQILMLLLLLGQKNGKVNGTISSVCKTAKQICGRIIWSRRAEEVLTGKFLGMPDIKKQSPLSPFLEDVASAGNQFSCLATEIGDKIILLRMAVSED